MHCNDHAQRNQGRQKGRSQIGQRLPLNVVVEQWQPGRRGSQMQCSEGCWVGDNAGFIDSDSDCDFWVRDCVCVGRGERGRCTGLEDVRKGRGGRARATRARARVRVRVRVRMYLYVFVPARLEAGSWGRANEGTRGLLGIMRQAAIAETKGP